MKDQNIGIQVDIDMHTWKEDKFGMFDHFAADLISSELYEQVKSGYVIRNEQNEIEMSDALSPLKNLLKL